jgi:hypothetical protein
VTSVEMLEIPALLWDPRRDGRVARTADPGKPADRAPWPLSELDASTVATSRRGIRLFGAVLLVLAGGSGLAVLGVWIVLPLVVGAAAYIAVSRRGGYPDLVAGVNRLGDQLSETYAEIERANEQIEAAHEAHSPQTPTTGGPVTGRTGRSSAAVSDGMAWRLS